MRPKERLSVSAVAEESVCDSFQALLWVDLRADKKTLSPILYGKGAFLTLHQTRI